MAIARFSVVALDCPDPRGLALFYQSILGGEIKESTESDEWVRLETGSGADLDYYRPPFMDFPGFIQANRADDPDRRAAIEAQVPMRRLGTMDEFAAFCSVFIDGTARFQTGQCVGFDGGWSN